MKAKVSVEDFAALAALEAGRDDAPRAAPRPRGRPRGKPPVIIADPTTLVAWDHLKKLDDAGELG
jgi:hypothetical protein